MTVPVLSERCATCVFRPGDPMHLRPGRLRELIRDNLAAGALLVCHETTYGQTEEEAMCRGFWDRFREQTNVWRVMERVARLSGKPWWREVSPPTP